MAKNLSCPRCGSEQLVRLAKNDVSPFRGYRCSGCQRRLRDRGSLLMYLIVLMVGLFFAYAAFANLDRPEAGRNWLQMVLFGFGAVFIVSYVVIELARPTPRIHPRAVTTGDVSWYVARNGVKTGPWSLAELHQQVKAAELSPNDMVQSTAGRVWVAANTIAGLFDRPADH